MFRKLLDMLFNNDTSSIEPHNTVKEPFYSAPQSYNYLGTSLDPNTPEGLRLGQQLGDIASVKQTYDSINRIANDNTKSNTERANAVKQAYGVNLQPPSSAAIKGASQVYPAGGWRYDLTFEEGKARCAQFGGTVATTAQLEEAQRNGADWCSSGWVAEGQGKWPINLSVVGGCGGRTGIIEWTPGQRAGVNCYGPKPDMNDPAAKNMVGAFNGQMWSQPPSSDTPTYLTVPSGYLETTGPQPYCFSNLSPEAAQQNCNLLGSQCVGFSYSKDGNGNGCYKGNHNAGMNNNSNYMGYVKVGGPKVDMNAPVKGRYIKLQYNRQECLNLAQILVYSTNGGPNIITPQTPVSKSSGYNGDSFPATNFVNGKGNVYYNFAHTTCNDVPWIQVDLGGKVTIDKIMVIDRGDCCQSRILGTTLGIYDDDNTQVYNSNPISSTNTTYAWFPPKLDVRVDLPEDVRLAKPAGPWTCLQGIPAPMRKNDQGEVECMSFNNRDCLWQSSNIACEAVKIGQSANPGALKPLVCGAMHQQMWGGPGYDNPGHWCSIARERL